MSLRSEPRGLAERLAAIEEWARKIDLGVPVAITQAVQAAGDGFHTLLHHVPGTISAIIYEPYFPLFEMTLLQVRGNLDTAPAGGDCVFDVLVDGASIFGASKPTIASGDLLGNTLVPAVTTINADQRIEIEVEQVNGAKGLVSAIEFQVPGGTAGLSGTLGTGGGGTTIVSGAPSFSISTQTTNYTAGFGELVKADASGGAVTITLPPVSGNAGEVVIVKKIDSSANAVTIDGDGTDLIDGASTQVLAAQWDSALLVSDGTSWLMS